MRDFAPAPNSVKCFFRAGIVCVGVGVQVVSVTLEADPVLEVQENLKVWFLSELIKASPQ